MARGKIVLISGGARSGKSSLALRFGVALGHQRAFVATARAFDDEMHARIARHKQERVGTFDTFEAPTDLTVALAGLPTYDVVVVDCVTHWISNLLLDGLHVDVILERVDALVATLTNSPRHVVFVTNEVGMSIHPPTPLGRAFVELAGWTNQRLAKASDEIYLAVMGAVLPVRISDVGPSLSGIR